MKLELHQSDLSLPPPSIPYADNSGEGSSDKINHCHSSPSWSSDHCFHNEAESVRLRTYHQQNNIKVEKDIKVNTKSKIYCENDIKLNLCNGKHGSYIPYQLNSPDNCTESEEESWVKMSKKQLRDSKELLSHSQFDESDDTRGTGGADSDNMFRAPYNLALAARHGLDRDHGPKSRLETCREVWRVLIYVTLAIAETVTWIKLYKSLDLTIEKDYIMLLLCFPTVSSMVLMIYCMSAWRKHHQILRVGTATILCILLISIPSPIFLHFYYLYYVAKSSGGSHKCRLLQNISIVMQFCRAVSGSLPLFLFGVYILMERVENIDNLDVKELTVFIEQNLMYLVSMFLSLIVLMVSVHRYNERKTSSIVSVLVTIPFTMSTVIIRSLCIAVIISFYPINWSIIMFSSLIVGLLVTNTMCETASHSTNNDEDHNCCKGFCCLICKLPGKITRAIVSIISPIGYNNDRQVDQASVHGGSLILLNYVLVMAAITAGLSTTVLYYIPNNYHGLIISSMDIQVEIPEVILKTGLLDVVVKLPEPQNIKNLVKSDSMEASILTNDNLDLIMAIVLPTVMIMLTLPITFTRLAMLGLDCILVRKEVLDEEVSSGQIGIARKGVATRLTMSLMCGLIAGLVTSIIILSITAGISVKLFT